MLLVSLSPAELCGSTLVLVSSDLLCARRLLQEAGKIGPESAGLPNLYKKYSVVKGDEEFLKYMYSVIYVESKFNRNAVSPAAAYGLMQMTQGAVDESVIHCKLKPLDSLDSLFDSATNIRYASCYLSKLLKETEGDWTRALIIYNGGYKQLIKYDRGDTITHETANYVLKVERALKLCSVDKQ